MPWLLFALTTLSTLFVGCLNIVTLPADFGAADLFAAVKEAWPGGLLYAGAVMAILFAHEMGHFLVARKVGVPASPPYFIPFPVPPFGTMGAVIFPGTVVEGDTIKAAADRRQMFDIAIAGPLAGLIVAIPICVVGVMQAEYVRIPPGAVQFGDPLLLTWIADAILGPPAEGTALKLNPLLFAGWVGLFLTAFNLVPIGQLDGGHMLYSMILRGAHLVSLFLAAALATWVLAFLVVWGMSFSADFAETVRPLLRTLERGPIVYGLMLLILILTGLRHPPSANDDVPLGAGRVILGVITLAFVIIGFTPAPILVG